MGSGGLTVDDMSIGCLGVDRRVERFFVLSHFFPASLPEAGLFVPARKRKKKGGVLFNWNKSKWESIVCVSLYYVTSSIGSRTT